MFRRQHELIPKVDREGHELPLSGTLQCLPISLLERYILIQNKGRPEKNRERNTSTAALRICGLSLRYLPSRI